MAAKETIRVRPPRAKDKFGDPVGPVPAWVTISGCIVVPRESQDYEQRGPIIISGFLVRLPASAIVSPHHEFEIRGEVYAVDGDVADYKRRGKIVYTTRAN